ncbi:MAG: 16S rRNA processing protein RimM [Bacteroidales bacterium]|nr:16S rRNA processing protein RimM [Bacteroidales bacterium]
MTQDECFQLGKITKPFGFKGQVVFFLDVDCPTDYEGLDAVFVETKSGLVPYFIKELNINGNKAVVTFEELTADEAHSLVGCRLFLPLEMLPKLTGNKFYFHEVIGWHVVDAEKGDIGTIESVMENPAQPLFQIMKNGVEILIPIIDPVIKKVDRKEKIMYIEAPNGLIDLYLQNTNQ